MSAQGPQPSFNPYGAVDLGALAARRSAAPAAPGGGGNGATAGAAAGGYVVEVSEVTFQADVVERSTAVPVVVDFWADWCQPCKQLTPILEKLAAEYAGRFVLASIDVDANQRIAAAAQVQSIPTVIAVVGGQALPLFQGALPEAQVRQYLEALLAEAARLGITGTAPAPAPEGETPAEPAEPPNDPRYDAAYDAIERGDLDAAAQAYRALLADSPADADAAAGLAQVELLQRTAGVDPATARAAADADPEDVDKALVAADLDLLDNAAEAAFGRLVDTVRRSSGDDRERVRKRLLELFEVVGSADPAVVKARAALTSALF